jgi:hypothetical protein
MVWHRGWYETPAPMPNWTAEHENGGQTWQHCERW